MDERTGSSLPRLGRVLRVNLNANRPAMIREELPVATRRVQQTILCLAHGPVDERRRDRVRREKLSKFFLSGNHFDRDAAITMAASLRSFAVRAT